MSSRRNKPLDFPMLIAVNSSEDAEGWLQLEYGKHLVEVRVISATDARAWAERSLKGSKRQTWVALSDLRAGHRNLDPERIKTGMGELAVQTMLHNNSNWDLEKVRIGGRRQAEKTPYNAARMWHTCLMSEGLRRARVVLWWSYKRRKMISPGIYCPDWETAAYAAFWLDKVRLCKKCNNPFVPQKDTSDYCSPAHGSAYRSAKSYHANKKKSV